MGMGLGRGIEDRKMLSLWAGTEIMDLCSGSVHIPLFASMF